MNVLVISENFASVCAYILLRTSQQVPHSLRLYVMNVDAWKNKYLLFSVISLQMTICVCSFIWNFSLASNNNDSMIWVKWSLRQVSLTVLDMISRYLHPTTRWLQGHCTNNTDELFVVIKQIKNEQKNVYAISNYYSCGRLLLSYSFGKL